MLRRLHLRRCDLHTRSMSLDALGGAIGGERENNQDQMAEATMGSSLIVRPSSNVTAERAAMIDSRLPLRPPSPLQYSGFFVA